MGCQREAVTLLDSAIALLGVCPGKKQQRKFLHAARRSGGSLALVTIWEEPKCLTEGKGFPQPFSGYTLSL